MAAPLPTVSVQAQFTPGTWTDISSYVLHLDMIRPSTRLQGPVWQYQAATCQVVLDNSDGRFDPDNLAGPYTSATSLRQVVWQTRSSQATWTAPPNLSGGTVKIECWGPGANGFAGSGGTSHAGAGGGGGEYAAEAAWAVTARVSYPVSAGSPGSSSTFSTTAVVAHAASGVSGGTGSANSIHFDGGAAGAGGTVLSGPGLVGGGGGSSGGSASTGAAGTAGNSGGAGGVPPAGAYGGGKGAPNGLYRGQSGQGPGGGGGGGGVSVGLGFLNSAGGNGKVGQVRLTYFVTITPSQTVTQVLPMVPVQVTALWNSVTYPLFNGFADAWAEPPVTYSAGYSEFTLSATDGFKVLAGNNLPATSPVGAGDDSGSRVDRILDFAGWNPAARALDAGDTTQQATTLGSDALSLLQLTADTEIGEVYCNGAGAVVFRHRRAILSDTRSNTAQAIFGDLPGTVHGANFLTGQNTGFEGGLGNWVTSANCTVALDSAHNHTPSGVNSMSMSSVAAGDMQAKHCLAANVLTQGLPVVPGQQVAVSAWFRTASASRSCVAGAAFYNSSGTLLSQVNGPPVTDDTAGWHQATDAGLIFAPAGAVVAVAVTRVLATGGALEFHYVDDVNLQIAATAAGTEIPYAAIGRADDDTTLANDIQITAATSASLPSPTLQEAQDPVSQYVNQGQRSWVRTDLLLPDDATAFQYANWVLYISKDAENRFDTLTIDPLADTASLYPQVLGREIGDRIQVWRRPSGVAAPVVKDAFIRGITHSHDPGAETWSTTWTLQSAAKYAGFLTLDSATLGLLDTDALAY